MICSDGSQNGYLRWLKNNCFYFKLFIAPVNKRLYAIFEIGDSIDYSEKSSITVYFMETLGLTIKTGELISSGMSLLKIRIKPGHTHTCGML